MSNQAGALAIALMFAASVRAGQPYEIHATLSHEGKPFASPVVIVLAGEPSTIETGGPDGFTLAIVATAVDATTVRLEADLQSSHGTAKPTLIVKSGERATITTGAIGMEVVVTPAGSDEAH